jgi:hypothetical protein
MCSWGLRESAFLTRFSVINAAAIGIFSTESTILSIKSRSPWIRDHRRYVVENDAEHEESPCEIERLIYS